MTDRALQSLAQCTALRSLHLGYTRITDRGTPYLTRLQALTELIFFGEDITDGTLRVGPR